ncbi:hypothetical protein AMECASPLE_029192 [Ameca splendens]|uniref:Uncharacterized protein n=1 Tax=Ameca splendens TaxID=208324 RepID=A0ABV0YH75_9TELE
MTGQQTCLKGNKQKRWLSKRDPSRVMTAAKETLVREGVTGRCFCAAVAHQGAINLGFKRSGEPEGGVSSLSHIAWKTFIARDSVVFCASS